jgi:hypothetical protein
MTKRLSVVEKRKRELLRKAKRTLAKALKYTNQLFSGK